MGNPIYTQPPAKIVTTMRGTGMNHTTWQIQPPSTTRSALPAKTIFLVRSTESRSIPSVDPRLTDRGVRQAMRIRDLLPADALANLHLIVTAPLQRTLQTSLLAFGPQIQWQGVPMKLCCDLTSEGEQGTPAYRLKELFPSLYDELEQHLHRDQWWSREGYDHHEEKEGVVQKLTRWLLGQRERVILVVVPEQLWDLFTGLPLSPPPISPPNRSTTTSVLNDEQQQNESILRMTLFSDGSLSEAQGPHRCWSSFNDELEAVGSLD